MKKQIRIFLRIASLSLLMSGMVGCKSLNSSFECPMKPGVMCKSLDQVNEMVDQGTIGTSGQNANCSNCKNIKQVKEPQLPAFNTPFPTPVSFNEGEPLRHNETVMKVWIAPFQDTEGNYHQESTIYSIVKPGHWIDSPVKTTQ